MKNFLFALAASAALLAGPALAEEASAPAPIAQTATAPADAVPVRVRARQLIYTADQERLGQVDRLSSRSAFVAAGAGRLVTVPLDSITRQDGRLVTSLTREQLLGSN